MPAVFPGDHSDKTNTWTSNHTTQTIAQGGQSLIDGKKRYIPKMAE